MQDASALTRKFIDQQAAAVHPLFGEMSSFDPETSQYQPIDMSPPDVSDLEQTLKQYHDTTLLQAESSFDPLKCTWKTVLDELEKAKAAVLEREFRGRRIRHKLWEGVGTAGADIFAPALVAIPNKLCVLQGGLAVIFSIARKQTENRRKILNAFEDIPNIMRMASDKAENLKGDHPRREQLDEVVGDFQKTLLRAIPALIKMLYPETFFEKAKNPFQGVKIDNLLDEVRNSSESVRACAEGMMNSLTVATNRTVHDNLRITQNIQTITQSTGGEVGELRGKVEEILKQQKHLQLSLDSISGKNSLLNFLLEFLRPTQGEGEKMSYEPPPVYESATPFTARQLVQLMGVDHLGALNMEAHIIRRGREMGHDSISHAASMFQTTEMQELLQLPKSGVLLVNGYMDRSQMGKISPITYVCATLTQALRCSSGRNVVLAFFCGQHSTATDDLAGPQGLMRSFVAYLLLALVQNDYISESDPIWFPRVPKNIAQLSFEGVCHIFDRLVELFPKDVTLHCVVDGISYFELPNMREDYDLMVECFSRIISNERIGATFKLLFTSPTISRWLSDKPAPYRQVSLRSVRGKPMVNPQTFLRVAVGEQ